MAIVYALMDIIWLIIYARVSFISYNFQPVIILAKDVSINNNKIAFLAYPIIIDQYQLLKVHVNVMIDTMMMEKM